VPALPGGQRRVGAHGLQRRAGSARGSSGEPAGVPQVPGVWKQWGLERGYGGSFVTT